MVQPNDCHIIDDVHTDLVCMRVRELRQKKRVEKGPQEREKYLLRTAAPN